MKISLLFLFAGLTAGLALPEWPALAAATHRPTSQEEEASGDDEEEDDDEEDEFANLAPFARYRALEKKRLGEELEGAWILTEHRNDLEGPSDDVRQGFMLFHEGFATIFIYVRTVESAFLGSREQRYAQAGSFRYRISDQLFLQTASMLGFVSGDNEEIALTGSGEGREYELSIDNDQLEMFNAAEGIRMTLRRTKSTDFPESALEDIKLLQLEPR